MRILTMEELSKVSGAGEEPPPCTPKKGNNGWGNGAEGINNGSDEGATASSKISESATGGPGPAKFDER